MAVYTVHEPPLKRYESSSDPERFAFVRDGFYFWAFVLAPLWMLRHRMWLTLIGYVAVIVVAEVALQRLGATTTVRAVVGLLLAFLVGFEAGTLRRFTLGRRGWSNVGIVVGDDRETAERRFFESWVEGGAVVSAPPPSAPPPRRPAASDVIGLFPEQSASR
jgi:hypothetical protein